MTPLTRSQARLSRGWTRPPDDPVRILIIDVTNSTWTTAPWSVRYPINWQRVAS